MIVCSSIKACSRNAFRVTRLVYGEAGSSICNPRPSSACFHMLSRPGKLYIEVNASSSPSVTRSQASQRCCFGHGFAKHGRILRSVTACYSGGAERAHRRCFTVSLGSKSTNVKLLLPEQECSTKIKYSAVSSRRNRGLAYGSLILGLLVCCSSSKPVNAEAANDKGNKGNDDTPSGVKSSHGKRVYTDYSITGIILAQISNYSLNFVFSAVDAVPA